MQGVWRFLGMALIRLYKRFCEIPGYLFKDSQTMQQELLDLCKILVLGENNWLRLCHTYELVLMLRE